jgi:hypothetical protein
MALRIAAVLSGLARRMPPQADVADTPKTPSFGDLEFQVVDS